ncbi:hypothetical protein ABFS82_10G029000 [Erythranthe guttata]|nr:PREDICTED: transcriptional regulator TAC1-like [Erythranthe guttata]|eukprot:XP_012831751.1 PREDICTED: transcriptional regulator TAC1-like [Erythranthe guttata]
MDNNPSSGGETTNNITTTSYSCSFCRRGFSNAQALGGHMNIHRRDRAKLMMIDGDDEFSRQNPPSKIGTEDGDEYSNKLIFNNQSTTNDDDDEIIIVVEDNSIHRSLPLFTEQTVAAAPPAETNGSNQEKAKTEKLRLIVGEDDDQLLDLELRLGPIQPNQYSKSKQL